MLCCAAWFSWFTALSKEIEKPLETSWIQFHTVVNALHTVLSFAIVEASCEAQYQCKSFSFVYNVVPQVAIIEKEETRLLSFLLNFWMFFHLFKLPWKTQPNIQAYTPAHSLTFLPNSEILIMKRRNRQHGSRQGWRKGIKISFISAQSEGRKINMPRKTDRCCIHENTTTCYKKNCWNEKGKNSKKKSTTQKREKFITEFSLCFSDNFWAGILFLVLKLSMCIRTSFEEFSGLICFSFCFDRW